MSDPETGSSLDSAVIEPGPDTCERVPPGDVLVGWFSIGTMAAEVLFEHLCAAVEIREGPASSSDLAVICSDVIQWYLRDLAPLTDTTGRPDPGRSLIDWFSDDNSTQLRKVMADLFETDADDESSDEELAELAIGAVQDYLRDRAADLNG